MILNVMVFKNDKIGAFTTPNFTDLEPEVAAKQLERSLILNYGKPETDNYKNLDLYFIGKFDDETGVFESNPPKFLLSCRELMLQLMQEELAKQKTPKKKKEEVAAV